MAAKAKKVETAFQSPHIEIVTRTLPNPNWSRDHQGAKANPRFIDVPTNARESGIAMLMSKNALDDCQAEAALIFRRLFEAMGGKGARAIDYSREFVEGGRFPDPIGTHQIDAGKKLAAAYEALTEAHGIYSWKIVSYVCGQGLSIAQMAETKRQRLTMTDNLRLYLDCLAAHWSLSTKRNVSGSK